MKQRLFTEILPLYKSKKNHPYAMRIRMRMVDRVDAAVLRDAVDTTMKLIGFEISPEYCAIAEERLTAITTDNAKEGYVTWAYPSCI